MKINICSRSKDMKPEATLTAGYQCCCCESYYGLVLEIHNMTYCEDCVFRALQHLYEKYKCKICENIFNIKDMITFRNGMPQFSDLKKNIGKRVTWCICKNCHNKMIGHITAQNEIGDLKA